MDPRGRYVRRTQSGFYRCRYRDRSIEAPQRTTLQPLIQSSAPIGIDEAMTCADDGDPLRARDGTVDYVGSESVSMHNVGPILPAERAYRAPLSSIIPNSHPKRDRPNTFRFERLHEGVWPLVARREHGRNAH